MTTKVVQMRTKAKFILVLLCAAYFIASLQKSLFGLVARPCQHRCWAFSVMLISRCRSLTLPLPKRGGKSF
ncbi:hypothetical protein HMPREF3034_01042 [Prevotella sp. DNF00663]|nr:hypothetical protein HMPREF3034_01042 [Prevotella sp. DNF00663]